jgi:CBS domain-containing protein
MQPQTLNRIANPLGTGMIEKTLEIPKCVSDLMTTKVVTLYPHSLFRDAVDLMAKNSLHHLIVVELGGSLAGIISDRDVLAAAGRYDSETTLVADIMTYAPRTVSPGTSLSEVVAMILDCRFNCFPVVNDSRKVEGILTTTDLLRAFQKLQFVVETAEK